MATAKLRRQPWHFLKNIGKEQAKDTGMILVLACLLLHYVGYGDRFLAAGILLLLIDLIWPSCFKPPARLWFGFSHLLGAVTSRVFLTLVFFLLVTPVGFIRRIIGSDPMQLRKWKQDRSSIFQVRDHLISREDIEKPY